MDGVIYRTWTQVRVRAVEVGLSVMGAVKTNFFQATSPPRPFYDSVGPL